MRNGGLFQGLQSFRVLITPLTYVPISNTEIRRRKSAIQLVAGFTYLVLSMGAVISRIQGRLYGRRWYELKDERKRLEPMHRSVKRDIDCNARQNSELSSNTSGQLRNPG